MKPVLRREVNALVELDHPLIVRQSVEQRAPRSKKASQRGQIGSSIGPKIGIGVVIGILYGIITISVLKPNRWQFLVLLRLELLIEIAQKTTSHHSSSRLQAN